MSIHAAGIKQVNDIRREPSGGSWNTQPMAPYVAKGYGRCRHGLQSPYNASQTLQLIPPQSTLVLERSQRSQRTQLNWRMFDWEKYSFNAQRKIGTERAT